MGSLFSRFWSPRASISPENHPSVVKYTNDGPDEEKKETEFAAEPGVVITRSVPKEKEEEEEREKCPSIVYILGDYRVSNNILMTLLTDLFDECEKSDDDISVIPVTRKDFRNSAFDQVSDGADIAFVVCIPVLERYIIDDPEDPSTGFTREIDVLQRGKLRAMIFVSYDDDVKQNENYHPALERLWNPNLTQDQEKFQNWQKRAIAKVLGLEQKESWKTDEQSKSRLTSCTLL